MSTDKIYKVREEFGGCGEEVGVSVDYKNEDQ